MPGSAHSSSPAPQRADAVPLLLAAGILLYEIMPEAARAPGSIAAALTLPLLGAALWRRRGRFFLALALAALGFAAASWQTARIDAPRIPVRYGAWEVFGTVRSVALDARRYKLDLEVERITGLTAGEAPRRVRVSVRGTSAPPQAGASVRLRAILYPPSAPLIPGGFDFARYFYYRGVGAVGYALPPVETRADTKPQEGALPTLARWRMGLQA
jgi:competence protein ComEC